MLSNMKDGLFPPPAPVFPSNHNLILIAMAMRSLFMLERPLQFDAPVAKVDQIVIAW